MGGGWLGMSKKIIFIFKTRQKMVTKLGQFTKLGPFSTFQLFKLSKLCFHFLLSFENDFFFLSLAIPRPLPSGIHWPINFANIIDVSVYFQQKMCKTEMLRRVPKKLVTEIRAEETSKTLQQVQKSEAEKATTDTEKPPFGVMKPKILLTKLNNVMKKQRIYYWKHKINWKKLKLNYNLKLNKLRPSKKKHTEEEKIYFFNMRLN